MECLERVLIFFAGQGGRQEGIGKFFSPRQHSFVVHREDPFRNHQAGISQVCVLEGLAQVSFADKKIRVGVREAVSD